MKSYTKFINEGLLAAMKPKSEVGVLKSLDDLNNSDKIATIIKYNMDYDLLPEGDLIINGRFECCDLGITKLPENLTVNGNMWVEDNELMELPKGFRVNGHLDCSNNNLTELPNDLYVSGNLYCEVNGEGELELPPGAYVGRDFLN